MQVLFKNWCQHFICAIDGFGQGKTEDGCYKRVYINVRKSTYLNALFKGGAPCCKTGLHILEVGVKSMFADAGGSVVDAKNFWEPGYQNNISDSVKTVFLFIVMPAFGHTGCKVNIKIDCLFF